MNYKKNPHIDNELFKHEDDLAATVTNNMTPTRHKKHMVWRREKILMLLTQEVTTYECASALKVSQSTCSRDVQWLREAGRDKN